MKLRLVPYKLGSQSAKLLAQKLGELLGYKVYRGPARNDRTNLLWGDLNNPCVDKLATFRNLEQSNVAIPEYTTNRDVALEWLKKSDVMVRKTLRGHAGHGCVFVPRKSTELPVAPLYVKYIPKKVEYRVYVVFGEVVKVLEKRKRNGVEANTKIQSFDNGWIFANELSQPEPADLRQLAVNAVNSLQLPIGGVDIIYNEKKNQCFVLEVNSAPGIEGSNVDVVANKIVSHFGDAIRYVPRKLKRRRKLTLAYGRR